MPLPSPAGPYIVSTLTLEVPARRTLSASLFRNKQDGRDPFALQTCLVTLFYPTALSSNSPQQARAPTGKPISWLNEPRFKAIEGLLKYGGLNRFFAYPAALVLPFNVKLPYGSDGPLASSSSSPEPFPAAVFSHGLCGSRTTYSAYLAELASHGMVIASVEHRDGSAPYTQVRTRTQKQDGAGAGDTTVHEDLVYLKFDELDVHEDADGASARGDQSDKPTIWDMRKAQLEQRKAEVLDAVEIVREINDGNGAALVQASTRSINEEQVNLDSWKGRLNVSEIWALGHSFGGATCIELLRSETSPFKHAVVLDPWLEPISKVGETAQIQRPLFVVNSDAFTIWRNHFAWLRALVKEAHQNTQGKGWLITLTKTKHTDFSDFPFVMPRFFRPLSNRTPDEVLSVFSQASRMAFEQGSLDAKAFTTMAVRDERPGEVEARDLGKTEEIHIIQHPLDGAPIGEEQPRL